MRKLLRVFMIIAWGYGQLMASYAQAPQVFLEDKQDERKIDLEKQRLKVRLMAADSAFESGFYHLAENLYESVLADRYFLAEEKEPIRLKYLTLLINRNKLREATALYEEAIDKKSAPMLLRSAMIDFQKGWHAAAEEALNNIEPGDLDAADKPWYFLLKGMLLQRTGHYKESNAAFEKAREEAPTTAFMATVDWMLLKAEIFSGKATDSLARSLEKKIRNPKKRPNIKTFEQYAIVLDAIGKRDEALQTIDSKLQNISVEEEEEVDTLHLLKATIAGIARPEGQEALKEILVRRQNGKIMPIALGLLLESSGENMDALINFLDRLIEPQEKSTFQDWLILVRGRLNLAVGEREKAFKDAEYIIEGEPMPRMVKEALLIQVHLAYTENPPKYRYIVELLGKLKTLTQSVPKQNLYLVLMAEAYFLNNDYANAALIYESLLQSGAQGLDLNSLLYQQVACQVHQGNFSDAFQSIDAYKASDRVEARTIWESEWNVLYGMKEAGRLQEAYARLDYLLEKDELISKRNDIYLRLLWLKAHLMFEGGESGERVMALVDTIMGYLPELPAEILAEDERVIISSNALRLKAAALLKMGRSQSALTVLQQLREKHRQSESAIISYILEARYYSNLGRLVEAQQKLIQLADDYPESKFAAIALFEAALNAETRGSLQTYQEALHLLERLAVKFPQSEFVLHARLKQGEILRKMNDFGSAQIVYENVLKDFSEHPDQFKAEMGKADCLLAQASKNPELFMDAVDIYERLFDLNYLPAEIRVEAGYKAGFGLLESGKTQRGTEMLWLVISSFVVSSEAEIKQTPILRYWLSRSVFELAKAQESSHLAQEARKMYQLVIDHDLPGKALAQTKIQ